MVEPANLLVKVLQMVAQDVAEPAELSGALVLQAELEGPLSGHGVEGFQPRVVPQDVQGVAIGLPQEFKPWGHQLPLGA
eukprot:scaffold218093_cov25-Prasinocladus_malaysianus.AAC.1